MILSRLQNIRLLKNPLKYQFVAELKSKALRISPASAVKMRAASDYNLNVGCGPNGRPGFINVDYAWQPGVDFCCDITKPLPFGSQSSNGIFSEHCLEHVPPDKALFFLKECFRILKPGKILRLAVPDVELYIKIYLDRISGGDSVFPYQSADEKLPMMSLNRIFRAHGHQYSYDYATLNYFCSLAGFAEIQRRKFRQGSNPDLLLDSEWRSIESLYIECTK